ncbi:MAG: molybdopterin oxidoreductase family protein [Desulfobacteraceae bacterium]|nr:MAG: molybdopterin oxidoreductase family protein [Desulfobacteraceae bacterium]
MREEKINSTCGFCSTGCNLTVRVTDKNEIKVTPNLQYPVNRGSACPKGFLFLEPLKAHDRATAPYMRNTLGELERVDWDIALQAFTDNFKRIQKKYGKESVAFLGTGQLPLEEIAFLGALAKFGMGMVHGDGNTRQCMATAAVAYKKSFGFDAPPFTYKDFEESDVLVFIGANPAIAHPIMWKRVKNNPNKPEIILIDPRKTETSKKVTQHYRIQPDSLLTFLYGIAHILIENDWIDQGYIDKCTTGFMDFQNFVKEFDPKRVSVKSGIRDQELRKLVKTIYSGKRVSFWWTMGVNQNYQAVPCAQAIINLALMTGNLGRPGTGANSITGQANAMGSRIFSNTTGLLAGHDFLDPAHRQKVADLLGIDVNLIPKKNSWAYDQILEGIENGKVKGLWIVCTNPAHSWINKSWLFKILDNLEYLVVQDMYHTTETAQFADLILPAAGCGEKQGTFINSERRLGVIRKIAEPPGSALPDFEIFKKIAEYWGCADLFSDWTSPAAAFEVLKRVSKDQPCDISGITDYNMIEQLGGIQWPYPEGGEALAQERRLFEDGKFYHTDGRARFFFEGITPAPEKASKAYPFVLITGRGTVAQWHTQTRTGKVEMLKKMYPAEVYVEIHLDDAARLRIRSGEWITIRSRRGEISAKASVNDTVNPGELFMPMHYFETNKLTYPAFDPYSREPSYKYAAVSAKRNRVK